LARRGHSEDRVIHTSLSDLKPLDVNYKDPTWQRPSEEEIRKTTEETRMALEKIVEGAPDCAFGSANGLQAK
jgi:SNW domain-containing protein 1